MGEDNLVKEKSFQFALDIIRLYQYLTNEKKEFVLSKQVLRSGTSIGANIEEALSAQSKKEFIAKLNISLKESRETQYWLKLLKESRYIQKNDLIEKSEELSRILTSIIISTKEKLKLL
ncbi:MAG TPA: four helix bundle protein [Candidatus Marinimicrobia bacterium]|nr:four helix bundle protein [Candidatus Neomarinimicrobiota bacterium]HRU92716.1 four helix bundle protein [Candidatus Neomarinimicrobiota bacterium]